MKLSTLTITYVGFDSVEFNATVDGHHRQVSVKVGSSRLEFPHMQHESGESLGDDQSDALVLSRAIEEITRLRCYMLAAEVA